jgi:hypothetical protein
LQQLHDVGIGEDIRPDRLVLCREQIGVRDKAVWVGPLAIETKISHDAHPITLDAGRDMKLRLAPVIESDLGQVVGSSLAHEVVQLL